MARHGPTIAETALQLIREHGPQQLDALVPAVVAAGRTRARDPRAAVRAAIDVNPEFVQAWDGRWCSLVDQLEGAVFTTPLTTLERQDEIVVLRDQLALVERLEPGAWPVRGVPRAAIRLTLTNGDVVERDIGALLWGPVFEPLRTDDAVFRRVTTRAGTVVWPGDADLDLDVLIWGDPAPRDPALHPPRNLRLERAPSRV